MNCRLRVRTVTPLHIGTGENLLRHYDYVTNEGVTYVLDQEAVLAREFERTGQVPDKAAGYLLKTHELVSGSPLVRYTLAGATTYNELHEQIKNVQGRCYLPGSSLKGALRTVLFAHAARRGVLRPNLDLLGRDKSWAARDWERQVFGEDPNHDLLRALQVADSRPLPLSPSPLVAVSAQVFSGGQPGSPIWVEAVAAKNTFETTIKLDDDLLIGNAAKLGWGAQADWLRQLPELANLWARERIQQEKGFATERGFNDALRLYQTLEKFQPKSGEFLLQLSWGAGWGAKTIGPLLTAETQVSVRDRYKLGKPPGWGGEWRVNPDSPFPKSRRLQVASGKNAEAAPGQPFGWVLVEWKEQK